MDDETPARSLSEPHKALLGYLCEQANDPNIRIFAVMDGAFFQNVDADLRNAGLSRRPLYRYAGDYSVVMGGPWMVDPYHHDRDIQEEIVASARAAANGQPVADITPDNLSTIRQRLEAIFQVASGKPDLVFWIGNTSLTPEAFYKHLRRLNKVLIPRDKGQTQTGDMEGAMSRAAATEEEEAAPPEGRQDYELVIFRHADANVMAQVLPALDHDQCARLLGPCHEILCAPDEEWGGRVKRLKRAEGSTAEPPPGPLRWNPQTIRAIDEASFQPFDKKLAMALRQAHPDLSFPGGAFLESVQFYRQQAQTRYGVTAGQHFLDFLEIVLVHGEHVLTELAFRQCLARRGWSMEEKFQRLRRHYLPVSATGDSA